MKKPFFNPAALIAALTFFTTAQAAVYKDFPAKYSSKFDVSFEGTKLTLLGQPKDQFLPAGTNATFSVSASSSPSAPITYQWLSNSIVIPYATNSTLTILNVSKESVGWYTCSCTTGSNPISLLTQPAALQVYYHTNSIIVYGYPPSGGAGGPDPSGCPGTYTGYINIPPSGSPALFPTSTSGSATDTQGNPTYIKCFSGITRYCGTNGFVSMPTLVLTRGYRFTIFFPPSVPLPPPPSSYALTLSGF